MGRRTAVVNSTLNLLFRLLCRIDDAQLRRIPQNGPAVLIADHTSNAVPMTTRHLEFLGEES